MEVWFAYEEDLPEARRAMGWTVPDYGDARVVDARDPAEWARLVAMNDVATCHAFGSYFLLPRAYAAFRQLRRAPCRRVWTTEAFNFHGWLGWLRLQRTRWHVWREGRTGFDLVLAMGKLGVDFLRQAGIGRKQLREFGYLVEPPNTQPNPRSGPERAGTRFVFVGQMIRRKGVDVLLRAAGQLARNGWSLDLIGDGEGRQALMALAERQELSSRAQFSGNQSNAEALASIQSADALVLPSRWDGWGAVVNEALMLGTPAIVSDACGAASLIVNERCGHVFRRGDEDDLRGALQAIIERGGTSRLQREQLLSWAKGACGATALAKYFLSCLERMQCDKAQQPPWRVNHLS
jgi:glycosyltransferase involved in cell wall biosynthesis